MRVSDKRRKQDHLEVCLNRDVEARAKNWFGDIYLLHRALPEMDFDEAETSITLFGHDLSAPIIIEAMTGGIEEAAEIGGALAEAAERLGIAMGVGSQRIAITKPRLASSFRLVRRRAPSALLIANIGCPQISREFGLKEVNQAIEMIDADAIAFHMNPLQEIIQLEGEARYRNVLARLADLVPRIAVPVIAKETGAGVCGGDAAELGKIGVDGIDVGGSGGTSWSAVEYYRAMETGDSMRGRLGRLFWDWGIPTTASIIEVRESFDGVVIASGGIRSGIDVAKALALGADCAGIALPLLKVAPEGPQKVVDFLEGIIGELKACMFLVGAESVEELKRVPIVITGKTGEWLRLRGLDPGKYARR